MSTRPKRQAAAAQLPTGPSAEQPPAKKARSSQATDKSAKSNPAVEAKQQATINFLSYYQSYFSPLLGHQNFITSHRVPEPKTIPYALLEKQPESIKATLKSYQMIGLSFLVWLHENGANGILG